MAVLSPCILFLLLQLLSTPPSHLVSAEYVAYTCNGTTGNFTSGSAFAVNLDRLIADLPGNASASPSFFASASVAGNASDNNNNNNNDNTAYGLALCRGDTTNASACSSCLSDSFTLLRRRCGANRDATLYTDLCTARYSSTDLLSRSADGGDNSPVVNGMNTTNATTYAGWDPGNSTSLNFYLSLVSTLFDELSMYGAYKNSSSRRVATAAMFINAELPTVYGIAQCTPDLAPASCWCCFQSVGKLIDEWYDGREGGRISGGRCSFRYEGYQFYQGTTDVRIGFNDSGTSTNTTDGGGGNGTHANKHKKVLIIAVVVPITVFCGLLLVAGLLLIRARRKRRAGRTKRLLLTRHKPSRNDPKTEDALKLWRIEESSSEFTLYDFAELAVATGDFSDDNLLGKGGFGPVYKGKLPDDGAEIAVKRLAAHSGQGLMEFKNEIQLIAKLQHTNLVRLVGCCVQEEEKMLVYEYLPNRSLDCFIFDQQRGPLLDWEKRRRVIEGIAQGLLYLHKHSRVRIIHRDLKASNILLDKDLIPKISDFGIARIFGSNDMTEDNTNRVVGTFGYMAPEYASEGIFSVKSDVYSFGVLLLEIVSGKRNSGHNHYYGDFINLLGYAWQLWREGRAFELIDPTLGECGEVAAIMRCVKVALLCVQDSATDRPTMADVTAMLATRGGSALPDPRRPPHFSLRVISGSDDDGSSSEVRTTRSQSHGAASSCSANDLTITVIQEGR